MYFSAIGSCIAAADLVGIWNKAIFAVEFSGVGTA